MHMKTTMKKLISNIHKCYKWFFKNKPKLKSMHNQKITLKQAHEVCKKNTKTSFYLEHKNVKNMK